MSTISVPERMLRPLTDCITPDVARQLLKTKIDSEAQARIDELSAMANRGVLTQDETEEYSQYVEYIDLIAIIKAKARLQLQHD